MPPLGEIVRSETTVTWGGSSYPPGSYYPPMGAEVSWSATARNAGDEVGKIFFQLWDWENTIGYMGETQTLAPDESMTVPGSVVVDKAMKLEFIVFHQDPVTEDWIQDDGYG